MFHRSMSLGRVYKSTLRSASSQNLIKATADVILFPQIKRNFFKYCKYLYWFFRGEVSLWLSISAWPSSYNSIAITTGRSNLMFPTWLVEFILGTTDPLTIGISAENQWVWLFFVNLDKMNKYQTSSSINSSIDATNKSYRIFRFDGWRWRTSYLSLNKLLLWW